MSEKREVTLYVCSQSQIMWFPYFWHIQRGIDRNRYTKTEYADIHFIYVLANGNGRVAVWFYGKDNLVALHFKYDFWHRTATAGSDVVQSGRPISEDFSLHLWPYIGNNTANIVF
ncbi:adhesion G protein-coupled receptor B2 [Trichonephila clavipes]|nr:adhesion G protein-coupled receptor B2 [Trichonephila clavipes]